MVVMRICVLTRRQRKQQENRGRRGGVGESVRAPRDEEDEGEGEPNDRSEWGTPTSTAE